MLLIMPPGFRARFDNFELGGFIDETLREGAERCPFAVPGVKKIHLAQKILQAGVKDIVFGSGPEDPDNIAALVRAVDGDTAIHPDWAAAFVVLLNCWEPVFERFRSFPESAKSRVIISLAMIDYQSGTHLFEQVVERFRRIGFLKFRVSLLNSFKRGIDEEKFLKMTREIDRAVTLDIDVIRINDSLGEIFPETMAILAANLTTLYPAVRFCLHAHDDRGLGIQNALASVYHGFDIIEAAFSGFGNRSGLAAIETLNDIFDEKSIKIRGLNLQRKALIETGLAVEETFLAVPNIYRATSGMLVNWENLGVANIPDYLGKDREARKFLNDVCLHPQTIRQLVEHARTNHTPAEIDAAIPRVATALRDRFMTFYDAKQTEYDEIIQAIHRLYHDGVVFEAEARELVHGVVSAVGLL